MPLSSETPAETRQPYDPTAYKRTETILRKFGGITDPDLLEKGRMAESEWRQDNRMAFVSNEETNGNGSAMAIMIDTGRHDGTFQASVSWNDHPRGLVERTVRLSCDDLEARGLKPLIAELIKTPDWSEQDDASPALGKYARSLSPFTKQWAKMAERRAESLWSMISHVAFADGAAAQEGVSPYRASLAYLPMTTKFEYRRIRSLLARFTSSLDPESVKIMRQTAVYSQQAYNWLQGDGRPELAMARRQAASAFPVLFNEMIKSPDITGTIDDRKPLVPALSRHCSVSETAVKRLSGIHWQRAGRCAATNPRKTLRYLGQTPKNWTPQGRKDWAAFHVAHEEIPYLASLLGRDNESCIRDTGGNWLKMAAIFAGNPAGTICDMTGDFYRRAVLPSYLVRLNQANGIDRLDMPDGRKVDLPWKDPDIDETYINSLLGGRSITKVMELNARWHQHQTTIDDSVRTHKANETWPALSQAQSDRVPGGLVIRPLTSTEELKAEGARMDHCVGGYSHACRTRGSHILSIETADGTPLSTVELRETGNSNDPLMIGQHYGPHNQHRDDRADTALQWYLDEIRKEKIEVDWDRIESSRREARNEKENSRVLSTIGFDPFDAENRERAFEAFKEFLPKSQRAMKLDEWLEKSGVGARINESVGRLLDMRKRTFSFAKRPNPTNAPRHDYDADIEEGINRLAEAVRQRRTNQVGNDEGREARAA